MVGGVTSGLSVMGLATTDAQMCVYICFSRIYSVFVGICILTSQSFVPDGVRERARACAHLGHFINIQRHGRPAGGSLHGP